LFLLVAGHDRWQQYFLLGELELGRQLVEAGTSAVVSASELSSFFLKKKKRKKENK